MSIKGLFYNLNPLYGNRKTLLSLALASTMAMPFHAIAQDNTWWFEVELIVFKRTIDPSSVDEQFTGNFEAAKTRRQFDLLTPYLQPDLTLINEGLPQCFAGNEDELVIELPADVFFIYPQLMDPEVDLDSLSQDNSWMSPILETSFENLGETTQANYIVGSFEQSAPPTDEQSSIDELERAFSFEQQEVVNLQESAAEDLDDQLSPLMEFAPLQEVRFTDSLACVFEQERFALQSPLDEQPEATLITEVPAKVDGTEWLYSASPYLLPRKTLQLTTLARDIARQRGVDELLHLGWRQNVLFGQNKAPSMRLFAGQNFAELYDAEGQLIIEKSHDGVAEGEPLADAEGSSDLLSQIRQALADENFIAPEADTSDAINASPIEKTTELWELDGYFKVFLRYIKSTPYLHIESELDYRAPVFSDLNNTDSLVLSGGAEQVAVQPDQLKSFKFKQLRRVISKQIHYFDHPLFGMVVQIRRHHKPSEPESDEPDLAYLSNQ